MSEEQRDDKLHADTPRTNAHLSHLNLPDGRKVGIPDQTVALLRELERQSAGAVTKVMVDRFLSWRLPKDFSPDNGISFKPIDHPHGLTHLWPTGTNLLNADQAKAMLEHVLAVVQSAEGLRNCGCTLDKDGKQVDMCGFHIGQVLDRAEQTVAQSAKLFIDADLLATIRHNECVDENGDPVGAQPEAGWETGYAAGIRCLYRFLKSAVTDSRSAK